MKESPIIALQRFITNAILNAKVHRDDAFVSDPNKANAIVCMRYDDWVIHVKPFTPMSSDLSVAAAPVCFRCKTRVVMVDEIFEIYRATPTKKAFCMPCIEDQIEKQQAF